MTTKEQRRRYFWAGVLIVGLMIVFVCVVLCVKAAMFIEVDSTESVAITPTPPIVYTDEADSDEFSFTYLRDRFISTTATEPSTYYRVYYPATMDERETLAEIIAGKAGNKSQTCQRMVANVIFNDIMDCQGDLAQAMKKYALDTPGTPTADTYEALDAIFFNGEYMLDDDVLWFNDKDHASAFHDTLVYVCECSGIVFYKQHWPTVVPGGAAE